MKKNEFMKLNNLKKINKDLNDFISNIDYSDNDSALTLEWKGFTNDQHIGRDFNGVSPVVSLRSITHECEAIKLSRWTDSHLSIFVKSKGANGLNSRENFVQFRYKDEKSKIHSMDNLNEETFVRIFGRVYAESIPYKKVSGFDNVISFPNNENLNSNIHREEITTEIVDNMLYNLRYEETKKVNEVFKKHGMEFVDHFTYTEKYTFVMDKIQQDHNSITFAYKTHGTYQSLPEMVTLKKVQNLKLHSLKDLGIESKGYYDHSCKLFIKDEDKKEALDFKKAFESIQ